jgi:methyl-accepting chemotaxis protein
MEAKASEGDGKTWYVKNPYMSGDYEDINVKLYESLKDMIKTELLNEISYRRFNENVSKVTPERKITRALSEVKKRVKEIEQVIEYFARLKDENAVKKDTFWVSKVEQLDDLSERLHELSQNVKKLSK